MPSFDVDGAFVVVHAEDGNNVCPVGVAEAGRTMPDVRFAAADAAGPDVMPCDGRILAVGVNELASLRPRARLGDRVDQTDHLVAGLPFPTPCGRGDLVNPHLPGSWPVGNIPGTCV